MYKFNQPTGYFLRSRYIFATTLLMYLVFFEQCQLTWGLQTWRPKNQFVASMLSRTFFFSFSIFSSNRNFAVVDCKINTVID